jgi:hypothetical protein
VPFPQAVARRLRALDPSIAGPKVVDLVAGRPEDDVRKALHATERTRPEEPFAYFRACLGRLVPGEFRDPRRGVRGVPAPEDPYAS